MFRHQLERAGCALRLELAGDLPEFVGDPSEWRQVAFNLLKNAMEASPAGSTVTVRAAHASGTITVEVLDEGRGIAPEHLDRIFEPFFTSKAPGKGTGLGLAIVHRIVTDHGGSVHAGNRADRAGACFRIEIPVPLDAAADPLLA
jgi:two-component system NtrC family sensor kinase